MKIAGIQIRRRFFVSVGLVITVTGAWFFWSRSKHPQVTADIGGQTGPFVRVVGAGQGVSDRVMEERAEFFDPTPLFLPTNRNFQQRELPAWVVKQPGQVFRDFESKLNFAESALPDYGATDEANSNSISEVLERGNVAPFAGFGASDRASQPLIQRDGFIEVKSLKYGVLASSEALKNLNLGLIDYAPVEFLVAVASAGLIGDPVMITTSGNDEIDGKLRDYLVNSYRIGERLAPGRYVVRIGP